MSTIPTMVITPSAAINAYTRTARADQAGQAAGFGATVQQALQSAVNTGRATDTKVAQAISGNTNLTEVITAVSQAELTLQTTTAVRDRVLQAYQDIMKMPI